MLEAAKAALKGLKNPPILLGVTVLTSLDETELARIGLTGPLGSRVTFLASMAKQAQMDGIVVPAREVESLRRLLGSRMTLVVPGIRPVNRSRPASMVSGDDQAQIATPGNAIRWGADYLVVGRPITGAQDPRAAMESILREIESAAV